ncbi:MAG: DNA gyrase subunit A, partial [Anaerolineae bacterium]|nr:DNA gyrase subunit A [Anaerolineae bacterium]
DLRDESDRQGMRLVIELTRTVQPKKVLTRLFKMTPLQSTFSVNMLGLVDGEPRLLTLKRALNLFIEHREEVIKRRSEYELDKAKKRAHILEGLRIALNNLDEVIQTIRSSRSADTARTNLIKKFNLTEIQANAILEMPLRRLAALERKKIETEYKEVLKQISYLEGLLQSRTKILSVIKEELADIKEKYGSPRRTLIIDDQADKDQPITARDLVPDEAVVVVVTESKHICRWPAEQLLGPAQGRQKDPLAVAVSASTQATLFLFTDTGRAIITPVHQIPQGNDLGDGPTLNEFSGNGVKEIVSGLALPKEAQAGYLFLVSEQGRVKRVQLSDLSSVRGNDAEVMGIDSGDKLLTAFITPGDGDVMLVSSAGQGIRFAEEEVRAMGLSAAGVWGIKLGKNDKVIGAGAVAARTELVIVSENGFGKRTDLDEFSRQGRYGQGVIALATSKETGPVSAAAIVSLSDRVMMISDKKNTKTIYGRAFSKYARAHKGQSVMAIRAKDRLARLVTLASKG